MFNQSNSACQRPQLIWPAVARDPPVCAMAKPLKGNTVDSAVDPQPAVGLLQKLADSIRIRIRHFYAGDRAFPEERKQMRRLKVDTGNVTLW